MRARGGERRKGNDFSIFEQRREISTLFPPLPARTKFEYPRERQAGNVFIKQIRAARIRACEKYKYVNTTWPRCSYFGAFFFFSFVRFFVSVLHTRYTKMVTTNSSWDGATNQRARRRGSRIIEMTRSSTIISRLRLEIWWLFFF